MFLNHIENVFNFGKFSTKKNIIFKQIKLNCQILQKRIFKIRSNYFIFKENEEIKKLLNDLEFLKSFKNEVEQELKNKQNLINKRLNYRDIVLSTIH